MSAIEPTSTRTAKCCAGAVHDFAIPEPYLQQVFRPHDGEVFARRQHPDTFRIDSVSCLPSTQTLRAGHRVRLTLMYTAHPTPQPSAWKILAANAKRPLL
jgi:hypothetical protein